MNSRPDLEQLGTAGQAVACGLDLALPGLTIARSRTMVILLKAWLALCLGLSAGGWILSWSGGLNRAGYLVWLAVYAGMTMWMFGGSGRERLALGGCWRRWARWRRGLPRLYGVLALVALLGALGNAPTNFDAYSYRLPRVLHWLAEGRWHWIHSSDVRLNVVAPLFDWLSAPFIAFFRSERPIWIVNFVSFLFLPGLIFSVFRRVGVSTRVAYCFMWIIPAGYCYAMQAGSLGNDGFAAVFGLAAIDFALRAREQGKWSDVASALAAATLLGAAKQSNFPLLLPWVIAMGAGWRVLRQRPLASALWLAVCGIGSILPTSVYNYLHVGNWKGFQPGHDYTPDSPLWGVIGNAFWIPASNLLPPIFPWAERWNGWMRDFLATGFGAHFRSFEVFGYAFRAAAEQYSGLGFGVSWLCVLTLSALVWRKGLGGTEATRLNRLLWWTPWVGLVVFMAKVGINQNPRYLAPYYPLLFPLLCSRAGMGSLVRTGWWHGAACGVLCLTILLVAFSRQRPVWPGYALAAQLEQRFPDHAILRKVKNAYGFTQVLQAGLRSTLEYIPPEEKLIGYAVRFSDKEVYLWKPFGSRRVERILNNDTPETVRQKGIRYALVDPSALVNVGDFVIVDEQPSERTVTMTIERWLELFDAELVHTEEVLTTPESPPAKCYLVKFRGM